MPRPTAHAKPRPALASFAVGLCLALCAVAPAAYALDGTRAQQRAAAAIEPETLDIALPFRIRAAIGARYLRHDRLADALTARYLDAPGPRVASLRSLETRVTLSHAIAPWLDLQVEWRTRNRIASDDPMGMGEQFVGALFRFTP